MGPVLTGIHTQKAPDIVESPSVNNHLKQRQATPHVSINDPEDALGVLQSEPDVKLLIRTLAWFDSPVKHEKPFNIKVPCPQSARIIFVLVNETVPNYWHVLNDETIPRHEAKALLVRCLSSIAGIGALNSHLRLLVSQLKGSQGQGNKAQSVIDLLQLLENILEKDSSVASIWNDINDIVKEERQISLLWKEYVSLIASGKLLAACSEANVSLNDNGKDLRVGSWVGDGKRYAVWLGRNIQYANERQPGSESRKALSQLLSRALSLGYSGPIVNATFSNLMRGEEGQLENARNLINGLAANERKVLFYSTLQCLADQNFQSENRSLEMKEIPQKRALEGVSALIAGLVDGDEALLDALGEWLIGTSAASVRYNHSMHRAVIVALFCNIDHAQEVMRKCLDLFAEKLYIKHSPILHQEVTTQILLMLSGYIFRANKEYLVTMSRSSLYLNAISNRLAASSPRARFLGMVFGTSISELIDPQDKRMKFGVEELESADGMWYRGLTSVHDEVGSITDLKPVFNTSSKPVTKVSKSRSNERKSTVPTTSVKPTSKIISIEEIHDSSDSDDEDLPLYEKPDSDPSDEDEDPTLVQRDRPTAPVQVSPLTAIHTIRALLTFSSCSYIRDLVKGLRDTENFDIHKLALSNAAGLIRRKAAFGTEVSDNIEDLATLLVGLSDKWEMEQFQQLRLQGMIAVLVAEPLKMGQWFSRTFYNGDYSMGQRASVLTTLSMGARELAGLGKEDAALTGANTSGKSFPSQRLPDKLHQAYALEAAPMEALSSQLEKSMIQPMAASAADQVVGPKALQVRTFSSRMAVEKKRQKPIPNALAKIVAEGFFFPLAGLWRIHLQTYGESSTHTSPFLLSHFLKTLALVLHASGSSTLSLPQMTSEFWDLLLSLRPRATDQSVLDALLFAFLTLLDINADNQRRLAEEHAKELLETQGWVENVFESVGGGSKEGDRIRMLAAGVLMRTKEVVEKYQRVMMGDMVDYMS